MQGVRLATILTPLMALLFALVPPAAAQTAGSAVPFALSASPLLGKDGATDVHVKTTSSDPRYAAPSALKKVQLKSFDTAGSLVYTANEKDLATPGGEGVIRRNDLKRGQPVQLQALAQTGRTVNTEVLRATGVVRLRPDLVIDKTSAPDEVLVGSFFTLSATVKETNGDLGARATVSVLDGLSTLDYAENVEVGAGASKGVAFGLQINEAGTYNLTVRVSNAVPGEYDATNNQATVTVKVIQPETKRTLQYYASYSRVACDSCRSEQYHPDVNGAPYTRVYEQKGEQEYFQASYHAGAGVTPRAGASFTLRADTGQEIGGDVASFQGYEYYWYDWTTGRPWVTPVKEYWAFNPDSNVHYQIYSYPLANAVDGERASWIYVVHWAGDYAYSVNYKSYWCPTGCSEAGQVNNGKMVSARESVKATLVIVDTSGTKNGGSLTLSLSTSPFDHSWSYEFHGWTNKGQEKGSLSWGYGSGTTAW